MTVEEVMQALEAMASATTKKTLLRHGAAEPLFGVRIGDLKPLVKTLKGQQELAMELYATHNSDAMYLAGLIADGSKMTRKQLDQWAAGAPWHMIAGCSVSWVAAEHPKVMDIALKWIDSRRELTALAGWSTLALLVGTVADEQLPMEELSKLLDRAAQSNSDAPDRVRYAMNNFIISCGTYVAPLGKKAISTARAVGKLEIDMGPTDCQVPDAESTILKSRRGANVAPKRKQIRC